MTSVIEGGLLVTYLTSPKPREALMSISLCPSHPDQERTWSWGVTIEEDAVGDGDPALARGVAPTHGQATAVCGVAARRAIDVQEALFGPSPSSSPPPECLVGVADGLTTHARGRAPAPLTTDGRSGRDP